MTSTISLLQLLAGLFLAVAIVLAVARAARNGKDEYIRPSTFSVKITMDNYEQVTRGKTALIKMISPTCPHCQELAPAWEIMARNCLKSQAKAGSWSVIVGEVDCVASKAQNKWCHENFKINGLPAILYGDPSLVGLHLEEYGGDRHVYDLNQFCQKLVEQGPICTSSNLDACDEDTRKEYEMYWTWTNEQLGEAIEEKLQSIDEAEQEFENQFEKLQAQYDEVADKFQTTLVTGKEQIRILAEIQQLVVTTVGTGALT